MIRTLTLVIVLVCAVPVFAVQVNLTVQPARCGLNSGRVTASAFGGLPPYTYLWSTGATSAQISGLAPGSYTVTVTDGQGGSVEATAEVQSLWELNPTAVMAGRPDCDDLCSGNASASIPLLGGTAPYTSSHPLFYETIGFPEYLIAGLCAYQPTSFTITDVNGCSGSYTVEVYGSSTWYQSGFTSLPACGGVSNGTIIVPGDLLGAQVMVQVQPFSGGANIEHIVTDDQDFHVEGIAPGNYYVNVLHQMDGTGEYLMPYCSSGGSVTVGNLPEPCGTLAGKVFNDVDQDCTQDAEDIGLPYRVLTIQPGDRHVITTATGTFGTNIGYGTFTLAQPLLEETAVCPPQQPVEFTIDAANTQAVIELADLSNTPHDVSISLAGSALRPGFPFNAYATITNATAFPSGTLTISMDLDAVLGAVTAAPTAAVNSNAHVEWELAALAPYSSTQLRIFGTVPPDITLLGTERIFMATVVNGIGEANTANNTTTRNVTVTGSYDPNDKQGVTSTTGRSNLYFLDADEHIDYTIRFQNTGTDTAFTVVVRDVIDTDLDLNSFRVLGSSHSFVPSFGQGREVVFTFPNVLLPDSSTDLLGSQGFISYRLQPIASIALGDTIANTAGIYFDFNPPIITNTVVHEVTTGVSVKEQVAGDRLPVRPNPTTDLLFVTLPEGADRGFRVLAVDGRVVEVKGMGTAQGLQLDVRSLAAGTYVVRTANGVARFTRH